LPYALETYSTELTEIIATLARIFDGETRLFAQQRRESGRCGPLVMCRVSGRPVAATSHERRNELFSIEAEARPNHWAVFTLGCRAILAPMTYSSQIGFGLASQGIDRQPLPSLRSDRFQLSVGGRLYETPTSSVFWG
jgi:hypothetical protein